MTKEFSRFPNVSGMYFLITWIKIIVDYHLNLYQMPDVRQEQIEGTDPLPLAYGQQQQQPWIHDHDDAFQGRIQSLPMEREKGWRGT